MRRPLPCGRLIRRRKTVSSVAGGPSYLSTAILEGRGIASPDVEEMAADRLPLGDLPLVVLSAERRAYDTFMDAEAEAVSWIEMHNEIADP